MPCVHAWGACGTVGGRRGSAAGVCRRAHEAGRWRRVRL